MRRILSGPGTRAGAAATCLCVAAAASAYTPGNVYFGRNNYIEYRAGDLPVVIDAPHGGRLTPSEIPDRAAGTLTTDANTDSLAIAAGEALFGATGRRPHVVICHLKRVKLDADRDIAEGAAGNQYAEQAWREFHVFLDSATDACERRFGQGLYVDIHAHAHAIQRLEIGYGLTGTALANTDAALASYKNGSTIRALADSTDSSFGELVRGWSSLGGLMQTAGYAGIPSPQYPGPGADPYFIGGYNTDLYGVGAISSIHLECQNAGIRDTRGNRLAFAQALGAAIIALLRAHAGIDIAALAGIEAKHSRASAARQDNAARCRIAGVGKRGTGGVSGMFVEVNGAKTCSVSGRMRSGDARTPQDR